MPSKKLSEPPRYHHGDLRKALMDGALELARSSGIEALSLREIARKIGVSTAAPYHHFKDRQSLLMALAIEAYEKLFETMRDACATAAATSVDPRDEIQAAALAYLHFGREHRAEYAIMFAGEYGGHPRIAEMMAVADACLDLVRAPISRLNNSRLNNVDAEQAAEAAFASWSLLHGILQLDQKGILRESPAEQDRLAVKGVLGVIKGFI